MLPVDPVTVRAAFGIIKMQTTAEKKLPEREEEKAKAEKTETGTSIAKGSRQKEKLKKNKAAKNKSNNHSLCNRVWHDERGVGGGARGSGRVADKPVARRERCARDKTLREG